METFPFDLDIHYISPFPKNDEQQATLSTFRELLISSHNALYSEFETWLTDHQLIRFLIARNYDLKKSCDMIVNAMKWRQTRKPHEVEQRAGVGSTNEHWTTKFSKESETGKIYNPGFDKWGRPVVIFDNTVQNTPIVDDHMIFLAWSLEFAIRQMKSTDKYVIFVHLTQFSFFNCPSWQSTRETLLMLCNCYPERLGHCIAYNPPMIFESFFNSIKSFIDPKTANKIVFIRGDVSVGSVNDLKMKAIIGDDWKRLTGACQEVVKEKCSPGYDHASYWPTVLSRVEALKGTSVNENESWQQSSST